MLCLAACLRGLGKNVYSACRWLEQSTDVRHIQLIDGAAEFCVPGASACGVCPLLREGRRNPSGGGGVFRPASSVLRPPCGSVFASRGLVPVGRYARGEGCYVFLAHGPLVITSHCIPDNLDIAPLEVRAATPAFS